MAEGPWAVGVDLGGTKVAVAHVDSEGRVQRSLRRMTGEGAGPEVVKQEIVAAVQELRDVAGSAPVGVGVGVAGQVEAEAGVVTFAPNLNWHNVPLKADLSKALDLPVTVINDVRAATWGEWLHGAGRDCDDIVCVFVGTGVGGGVVSGGHMLSGCSNTAGELGHMTIELHGPRCTCGNDGCLEALAGGWAIARDAERAVHGDADAGAMLLNLADGDPKKITAAIVAKAYKQRDALAQELIDRVVVALVEGAVSLVNAFNPCRLIFGGGVVEGLPGLVDQIDQGVRRRALKAAQTKLEILLARLHEDAGLIGTAALTMRSVAETTR
jgi:glucokinase